MPAPTKADGHSGKLPRRARIPQLTTRRDTIPALLLLGHSGHPTPCFRLQLEANAGVEFTKGKRPGVRWGAELAPDSMGRAVIGSEKEDAYPWCNCEKQGIA